MAWARRQGERGIRGALPRPCRHGAPQLRHRFPDDRAEVWAGTQAQTINREDAARDLGLKPEKVTLHTMYLGGGFGRRGNPHSDYVVEAAEVAKAVKKPVKVVWTREDDTKGGYYRPFWYDGFSGGLDESGRPVAWRHTIVGQSIMSGTLYAEQGA